MTRRRADGSEGAGSSRPEPAHDKAASADPRPTVSVSTSAIVATGAVLAGLWAFDALVLRTSWLATFAGREPLTPLYAFWSPRFLAAGVAFPALALLAVLWAPRLCDPARTRERAFACALAAIGVACAYALFLVRAEPASLGSSFDLYRDEEFWHDAQRVESLRTFLGGYVQRMPELSTHGRHFPPGYALLLAGSIALFGRDPLPAAAIVLLCAALALPVAWCALRRLLGERAARQAALLVALAPAFLDFACTSMDAGFLLVASIAMWSWARACASDARAHHAAIAGLALFVASLFSFSALPLALALGLATLLGCRTAGLRTIGIAIASFAAAAVALWLATGFALWECFAVARANAGEFMERVRAGHPGTARWQLVAGNVVAFANGAGAPLVAACALRCKRGFPRDPASRAALATFVVLAGLHWLETERIWLYALPWVATIALADGALDDRSLRRLAAVAALQAFALEIALYTLW